MDDLQREALTDAYRNQLAGMLTEPMTVSEIATWFGVARPKARRIVALMAAAERIDRTTYRLPVWRMPPSYLQSAGLIR